MRLQSIDIFRGLTMFLMVFVNDLWSISGYPKWLGHAAASEDYLGFSDIIFPAFLFIVGLSIPFALENRLKKGDSKKKIFIHILERSFALIVMGFFLVNYENIHAEDMVISKNSWKFILITAFFLLWTNYKDKKALGTIPSKILIWVGAGLLLLCAYLFKDSTPGGILFEMNTHWWGILGLIGWSYLFTALAYIVSGKNLLTIILLMPSFLLLNFQEFWFPENGIESFRLIISASNFSLVWMGVLSSVLIQKLPFKQAILWISGLAISFSTIGFLFRPFWGISKIGATPSWTLITGAISLFIFGILYWISDIKKTTGWAKPLNPAGRSTLTCYLIPYYWYGFAVMIPFSLPEAFTTGWVGIVKCLVFASCIVLLTKISEHFNLRLKI